MSPQVMPGKLYMHEQLCQQIYQLRSEITALVNEEKSIGTHTIEFDATSLPSGIYFYQLQTPNFTQTKKMILLK
jgi:hypothetical protein